MTFNELQLAAYADLGYSSSPPSGTVTQFKRWINDGHYELLRMPGMSDLRQGILPNASVASYAYLPMPQGFERIDSITDTANMIKLQMMSREEFRRIDPGETASGTPTHWIPYGWSPVLRQPVSTGSAIYAVSSQGADTTQVVYLQYLSSGQQFSANNTLTGTSRVAIALSVTANWIEGWSISVAATGNVSLYDAAAAGNLLATILVGATSVQYQQVRLWPTPTAALTYTIEGQLALKDLVNATDVPWLPPDYHNILVLFAKMREYQRTNDDRLNATATEWTANVNRLKQFVQFPPDYRPVAGVGSVAGWNNLGSYYPADWSWF